MCGFYCLVCHLTVTESDLFDGDCHISGPEQRNLTHDSLTLHLNDGLTDGPRSLGNNTLASRLVHL